MTEVSVAVRVPAEPPELNPAAARLMLAILAELTKVELINGSREGGMADDR